jgi:hypothetical protein
LLRGGVAEDDVEKLVATAARIAGDEEWTSRGNDVRATAKTLANDEPATGAPTLAELLGQEVVRKIAEFLQLPHADDSWQAAVVTCDELAISSFRSSCPWPAPLAPEALYGLAGDVVRTIDPHTEADPAALLLQFLVAFGNLVGRGPHFAVEADQHFTNLYAVMVGETSKGRKGTSLGHVQRLLSRVDTAWASDRIVGGLSSGEGLIDQVRDPLYKDEDVSEEGDPEPRFQLRVIDRGVADKRLLVIEQEFASTLRVLEREGNTLSPIIRNAWDGKKLQTLTRNSPLKATNTHVSIAGHVTRNELCRYLNRTEAGNGFANRFLWVCVRRSKQLPEGGNLQNADIEKLAAGIREAVDFARSVDRLFRDADAAAIWRAVYGALSDGKPGLFGAVIGRAEAQVMRLGCLYALLDGEQFIRRPHLLAALAVWDYCEASARHIFGDALGDPVADEILNLLRAAPRGRTRTEIRDHFARNRSKDVQAALRTLLEQRLAAPSSESTGKVGHPIERWRALDHTTQTTESTSYLQIAKAAVTNPPPPTTQTTESPAPGDHGLPTVQAGTEGHAPAQSDRPPVANLAPATRKNYLAGGHDIRASATRDIIVDDEILRRLMTPPSTDSSVVAMIESPPGTAPKEPAGCGGSGGAA